MSSQDRQAGRQANGKLQLILDFGYLIITNCQFIDFSFIYYVQKENKGKESALFFKL